MRFSDRLVAFINMATSAVECMSADALLIVLEDSCDWEKLRDLIGDTKAVLACQTTDLSDSAKEAGFETIDLPAQDAPVHEQLTQSLLECVAREILKPGNRAVCLYSGFEADIIDSISVINLGDHLGRLTSRDLQSLETKVPLETLKVVVDLALQIGREGREGSPVGTMFVVGDHRKIIDLSSPLGFDAVKGYSKKERTLFDRRVREAVKEIAQLDGAFVIAADATVSAACRYIDAPAAELTLSKGLGTRHWTAAAITKNSKAVAVAVSESSGTVRIFLNGQVVLRIEPFRRPVTWKEFEFEPPTAD